MLAVVLTQFLHGWAMLRALTARKTRWRGIEYRIGGPRDIQMTEYLPIKHRLPGDKDASQSIEM
jgi:hypothetical protein